MKNLREEMSSLYLGDFGEQILEYSRGYIGDVVSEIADSNVDVYNYDLLEWVKGNYSYVEEAIEEFGFPETNGKPDFIRAIMQGQYLAYEQDLYSNLEDSLKYYACDYIVDKYGEEITDEQYEKIFNGDFDFTDNNEHLENLIESIDNVLGEEGVE